MLRSRLEPTAFSTAQIRIQDTATINSAELLWMLNNRPDRPTSVEQFGGNIWGKS